MIEAAIDYAVIEQILTILHKNISPDKKNKEILEICTDVKDSLHSRIKPN